MRKIFVFLLSCFIVVSSFVSPCLAADSEAATTSSVEPERITVSDDVAILYLTTVIDLNTGTEYHAKTGEPCIIEAELGHQYSVIVHASVSSHIRDYIDATTRIEIGNEGLSINSHFSVGGGTRIQAYSFVLPEGTKLAYVDGTAASNYHNNIGTSIWKKATGNTGLQTYLDENCPVNDSFILEVVDKEAEDIKGTSELISTALLTIAASIVTSTIVNIIFHLICTKRNNYY